MNGSESEGLSFVNKSYQWEKFERHRIKFYVYHITLFSRF